MNAPRAVAPDTVVSLEVVMHDAQGGLIHASDAPLEYLHGGYGGVFEGIERAVEGKRVGDTVRVHLEPEDAFGEYDAELVRLEPRERYGEGLATGMEVEDAFGGDEPRTYIVTDIAGDKAVLDGNHPLAGIALRFTCKVLSVRKGTADEIERGAAGADDAG